MALPSHAYGDPALIAERDELHRMGCGACERAERVLGKHLCTSNLKYPACRQEPRKGYKLLASAGGEQ